jgi:hypothetical protein
MFRPRQGFREKQLVALRMALLVLVVGMAGCAIVKINKDDTTSIEYRGSAAVGRDYATRACRKGGQRSADIISIQNKDAARPAGQGRQVVTFRCTAKAPGQAAK